MPVKYNKQLSKNGASVGSVVSIVRPQSYNRGSSTNPNRESLGWNIEDDYPGWLECDGRTLQVSEYMALYSVIGNTYGGNPGSTFKLPDYRSKKICGTGNLNGNKGGSLSLTTTKNAQGSTGGGGVDEAGATGGIYTLSTVRQLPDGSEITPSTPSNPGNIGGTAIDTFSLGTFRSQGFSSVVSVTDPVISGSVTFGVGPLKESIISGVPPHTHYSEALRLGSLNASQAPASPSQWSFFQESQGSVISFNRTRRPWPGPAPAGVGDYFFYAPVDNLSGTGASLSLGPGTSLRSYGPGSSELDGFANPGQGAGSSYLAFGGDTGPFVQDRSATITVNFPAGVSPSQVNTFFIQSIAGNDGNGGERVNSEFDSLYISINGSSPAVLLESAWVFYNGGDTDGFDKYDEKYDDWYTFEFEIPPSSRSNPLTITLTQGPVNPANYNGVWVGYTPEQPGDPPIPESGERPDELRINPDPWPATNQYDTFGISSIGVKSGGGPTFSYGGVTGAVPLQRHSHMLYWNTPNDGDTIPDVISTYGTGGGSDNNILVDWSSDPPTVTQVSGDGLRVGQDAGTKANLNSSVGNRIFKTIDVVQDIGNGVNPTVTTLSDSSRVIFDNAIDVRLQAADPITLLSPYFRAKYIIKAF